MGTERGVRRQRLDTDYPRPVAASRILKGIARTRGLDVEVALEGFSVALRVGERKLETATALESGRHLSDCSVQEDTRFDVRRSFL